MMDEYESDVEMVPIEEIMAVETTNDSDKNLRPELRIEASENSNGPPIGTFTTGIDIFSKEERLKMEERAKRFGLTEKCKESLCNQEDLYSSMGVVNDGENAKNVRLNVIHMRGTEDMSTKDVLKYFQDYAPQSIEWINDVSCNVVWFDNLSAARAMLGLSKKILGSYRKYSDTNPDRENDSVNRKDSNAIENEVEITDDAAKDGKKDNYINIEDIKYPLPPGIWRKGIDYPKSKGIFLRFATRMDKKQANAEKMSEYYKKYGNPNFGGIKGILTESRKRLYKQTREKRRNVINTDEEQGQNQKKNPWGALSKTWGLNDVVEEDFLPKTKEQPSTRSSIKNRLGTRNSDNTIEQEESGETSSNSDSDEEWCKRSKVLRMRMHADDEEEKQQKRRAKLRYQKVLNNLNSSGDLRSRLGRPAMKTVSRQQYPDPIQVVVTNTNLTKSNSLKYNNSDMIQRENLQITKEVQSSEREEGEWNESDSEAVQKEESENEQRHKLIEGNEEEQRGEEEDEEEEEEEGEHKDDEDDSAEEDSDVPAKEVQGPKGSVIKVVPPRPRIASTVWARLNHVKSEVSDSYLRQSSSRDLRSTLKGGDLRSRIGNHTRGRSPLRIEVKNDKYTKDKSD